MDEKLLNPFPPKKLKPQRLISNATYLKIADILAQLETLEFENGGDIKRLEAYFRHVKGFIDTNQISFFDKITNPSKEPRW